MKNTKITNKQLLDAIIVNNDAILANQQAILENRQDINALQLDVRTVQLNTQNIDSTLDYLVHTVTSIKQEQTTIIEWLKRHERLFEQAGLV